MTYNDFAIKIIFYISLVLMYTLLVTLVGYFRALAAKWMGDDTAERAGFLTINPAMHVDPLGLFLLLVLKIGWGRQVPVNAEHIYGPCRWLKLSFALLSSTIAYMFFALVSLVALAYVISSSDGIAHVAQTATQSPLISLLSMIVYLCTFLAAIEFVINLVFLGALFLFEHYDNAVQYASYALLIVPIIIFVLYGAQIQFLMYRGITSLAALVAKFICGA